MRSGYADSLDIRINVSRIVEGVSKVLRVARQDARNLAARGSQPTIEIVVLTDGLEEGTPFGNFECKPLPTAEAFVDRVLANQLIGEAGDVPTRIVFGFTDLAPIARERCSIEWANAMTVEALWRTLFDRLGLGFAVFSGAPDPIAAGMASTLAKTTNDAVKKGGADERH